jgi:hypothetical protein
MEAIKSNSIRREKENLYQVTNNLAAGASSFFFPFSLFIYTPQFAFAFVDCFSFVGLIQICYILILTCL